MASYFKGAIFLRQLCYVIGEDALQGTLRSYYDVWKFKPPTGSDFIRLAEKESNMGLDWYYEYWVTTTKTIDYAITDLSAADGGSEVTLARNGLMPMPLDLVVEYTDGTREILYIPLRSLWRGQEDEITEPKLAAE